MHTMKSIGLSSQHIPVSSLGPSLSRSFLLGTAAYADCSRNLLDHDVLQMFKVELLYHTLTRDFSSGVYIKIRTHCMLPTLVLSLSKVRSTRQARRSGPHALEETTVNWILPRW